MANSDKFKILVFSKTAGYRHESIPAGIRAIQELGAKTGGFSVDASEDASLITARNLAQYAAVVFLQTSGDVLDEQQLASLQSYVRRGNGFVGVHCAAAGLPNVPWRIRAISLSLVCQRYGHGSTNGITSLPILVRRSTSFSPLMRRNTKGVKWEKIIRSPGVGNLRVADRFTRLWATSTKLTMIRCFWAIF
jgi:hypothetical protein